MARAGSLRTRIRGLAALEHRRIEVVIPSLRSASHRVRRGSPPNGSGMIPNTTWPNDRRSSSSRSRPMPASGQPIPPGTYLNQPPGHPARMAQMRDMGATNARSARTTAGGPKACRAPSGRSADLPGSFAVHQFQALLTARVMNIRKLAAAAQENFLILLTSQMSAPRRCRYGC